MFIRIKRRLSDGSEVYDLHNFEKLVRIVNGKDGNKTFYFGDLPQTDSVVSVNKASWDEMIGTKTYADYFLKIGLMGLKPSSELGDDAAGYFIETEQRVREEAALKIAEEIKELQAKTSIRNGLMPETVAVEEGFVDIKNIREKIAKSAPVGADIRKESSRDEFAD